MSLFGLQYCIMVYPAPKLVKIKGIKLKLFIAAYYRQLSVDNKKKN